MSAALEYHDRTKHAFNGFARSLGYLDWASQPNPFRRFEGARVVDLPRRALATDTPYAALYDGSASPHPLTLDALGEFLRVSLGLTAWKQFGASRWALRANPSSGNLHPTEGYVAWDGRLWHYAPREHALEERCACDVDEWQRALAAAGEGAFVVGVTSIIWREAWKYGERAFRYCQHDVGHAIAALRFGAALLGWRLVLLPATDAQVAAILGTARAEDFGDAEREEPELVALVSRDTTSGPLDPDVLAACMSRGQWSGRANRLSAHHVEWPVIDTVAEATRTASPLACASPESSPAPRAADAPAVHRGGAREILLRRRSAVAYDATSSLEAPALLSMLRRTLPGWAPFDALPWAPHVNLVLFVHRVRDLSPGVYVFIRDLATRDAFRAACRAEFMWEPVAGADDRLFLLVPIDCRRIANRLSCDQDIAEDGFFSLGMIARFDEPIRRHGDAFYRRLFWEAGAVGQVLYLEAEAAGARSTGIGCYYDDPVHDLLGLTGHAWQSLYHFSAGMPVEDERLTTEPGYAWEARGGQ